MLLEDDPSSIPFAQLDLNERLDRVDFLASTISKMAFDLARGGDLEIARTLIEIGWMLKIMREDLAMCCSPDNVAIINNAVSVICAAQTFSNDHCISGTVH